MARVLLADDDDAIRQVSAEALRAAGHEVFEASNGRAALKLLATTSPDVLIVDILMPDTDGMEVLLEVRRQARPIRIIAISGGGVISSDFYLSVATKLGVDRTLRKPCSAAQLVRIVAELAGAGGS